MSLWVGESEEVGNMLQLMCTSIHLDFFTMGQVYYAYDGSLESGVYVSDDDNESHYLSSEFIAENFKEV